MALTKVGKGGLDKGAIKDQTNLGAEAADTDEFLLYDASADGLKAIQSQNVVGPGIITNKTEITTGNVAGGDLLLIYDTSAGVLKKISKTAFDALQPAFSSVTPSNLITGDGSGNFTIVVAGSDFDTGATFKLVTDGGTDIAMDSVSRDSAVQLTGTVAKNKANLTNANEPFDIVITNGNNLTVTSSNAINIDAQPAWVTSAGSLSTIANGARSGISITVTATDPESGAINYALTTGALPGGLSLNTSTGVISGDADAVGSNTTFNFTIEARDTASNATERDFSIAVQAPQSQSFTSSGTFSVPSGISTVDVLVVAGGGGGGGDAGGGGGAGGLIYRPGFSVTPGGTVSVTVGDGGTGSQQSAVGDNGQDSVFGTLTAKGGGGGGGAAGGGNSGGSGGGARSGQTSGGASANQPTQSGESGNYGFGNPGGNSNNGPGGGGGGGAGGAGAQNGSSNNGGDGGVGKAYTISDGTTSVYYAGGGGGAFEGGGRPGAPKIGIGGQGGGGQGGARNTTPAIPDAQESPHATGGQANRGGGGGGNGENANGDSNGGKGIVIVRY